MANPYANDTPTRRPMRTILTVVTLAFLGGLLVMAWALTRWGPGRALIAPQLASGPTTAALPHPAVPSVAVLPTPTDPVATPSVTAATDARVADLEAKIDRLDLRAAAAATNTGRAEGLLIAFAARRAIDRGVGLGYLERQLQDRFGETQPRAVASVIAAANAPMTLPVLRQQLDALAPTLQGKASDEGWWDATRRTLSSLIIVKRAGEASAAPEDRVHRAVLMIDAGQLEGALAEIARLPAHDAANAWMTNARRYIEAHHALDIIEAAAIMPPPAAGGTTPAPITSKPATPPAARPGETL